MPAERSICMETAAEYIEKTKRTMKEVKIMRHIYIRGIIGLTCWLQPLYVGYPVTSQ